MSFYLVKSMLTNISLGEESSFGFWKNVIYMTIFFTIAPLTLGISLFSLFSLEKNEKIELTKTPSTGIKVYASLPSEFPMVSGNVTAVDARPALIGNYLARYNSPLLGMENYLVAKSDEYNMDYRLLPAIAQQESNLCKLIPYKSYNCWGWGIHSEGSLGFDSYEEAIDTVMKGIKTQYIDKGLTTPDTIWKKYTPNSPDGAWAKGVNQFMNEML